MQYTHKLCLKTLLILQLCTLVPSLSQKCLGQSKLSDDFRYALRLSKESFKVPAKHATDSYLVLGAFGVGSALLLTQDATIMNFTQAHKGPTGDFLAHRIGEPFGSPYYQAVAFGGLYLGSKFLRKPLLTERSIKFMTAAALSGTTTLALKAIFARARPYTNEGPTSFFTTYFQSDDYLSFPSAHTTLAFSFASTLSHMYPRAYWIPFVVYPLAGLSAWSRVYDQQHWPSDVFAGAIIGHFIGKVVAQNKSQMSFALIPNAFGGSSLATTISF